MGMTSKFIEGLKSANDTPQAKVDTGGNYNKTMDSFSDSGNDSPPLKDDIIASTGTIPSGGQAAVGCIDPKSGANLKAGPGEKRIYSRDSDGNVIAEIWLKEDGAVLIENPNGTIELQNNGKILINGVEVDTGKNIKAVEMLAAVIGDFSSSLKVGTLQVLAHTHPGVTVGAGSTGAMVGGPPVP